MLFFAFLLGQAGYTLAYAGATGHYWQDPWTYVAEALGQKVNPNPSPPQGAQELAAALLGVVAWKALLASGGSLIPGSSSSNGNASGTGEGEKTAESEGETAGKTAESEGGGFLGKVGDFFKNLVEGTKGEPVAP